MPLIFSEGAKRAMTDALPKKRPPAKRGTAKRDPAERPLGGTSSRRKSSPLDRTELCRWQYNQKGAECHYGTDCTFAHSLRELKRGRDNHEVMT